MARRRKSNTNYKFISSLILICILVLYFFFAPGEESDLPVTVSGDDMYVHFIDVGQGDAALIQTASGNLLIDAGTSDSIEALTNYINALGVETLDYAIFTHPHADHIGGATAMLNTYTIKNVIMPNAVSTSATFEKMLAAIEAEQCEVIEGKAGVSFSMGEVQVDLLAPVSDDFKDLNNASVVAKITYGNVSFLFTGDAETSSESEMLEQNAAKLNADILKVGHHGSSTSSSVKFLAAVSPEVAVVSVGLYNEYGHPHAEVVSRLEDIDAAIYRTDKNGRVVIYTDGTKYEIQTEK